MFFFISVVSSLLSYLNFNPMNSSLFLIFSLIMVAPLISFLGSSWVSYFICLLFLSGIFVILVYFSSVSKLSNTRTPVLILLFLMLNSSVYFIYSVFFMTSVKNFYYDVYFLVMLFIIFWLLMFMIFTSVFLSFSGALRKI